jgi:hypothetical protein
LAISFETTGAELISSQADHHTEEQEREHAARSVELYLVGGI